MAVQPRLASESIAGQRPYQEDAVLVKSLSDGRVLLAVADGMGGHAAGEVASALALETLVEALESGKGIDGAFALANRKVHRKSRDPGKQGMGTTLVAALVEDGEYMIANVGDSRGYLLSDAGIRQITEDHSFVAEAMKRGQTQKQAMDTPWKDALTRSIGTEPEVDVDVFGPFPVEADTALIVCSDGLYKTLDDEELRRIFVASGSVRGAAQTLVSAALESGSDDNISVAIAEYGEVPRVRGRATLSMDFDPGAGLDDPAAVPTEPPAEEDLGEAERRLDPAPGDAEEGPMGTTAAAAPPEPRLDGRSATLAAAADHGSPMTVPTGAIIATAVVVLALLVWLVAA